MDVAQGRDLFLKGKDEWNKWAKQMLDEKQQLQKTGQWEKKETEWKESATVDIEFINTVALGIKKSSDFTGQIYVYSM